jgi:hypothetical protein
VVALRYSKNGMPKDVSCVAGSERFGSAVILAIEVVAARFPTNDEVARADVKYRFVPSARALVVVPASNVENDDVARVLVQYKLSPSARADVVVAYHAVSESLLSRAFCRSVWLLRVPVMLPHTAELIPSDEVAT